MVGGELTLESLELSYNATAGFYKAPVQAVANGGVLVIDDFGRQRVAPRDLLNRWIVPLESRVDFLTLNSGQKFELPFMTLVAFATNIRPQELVDEAFLRRIHYKVLCESPTLRGLHRHLPELLPDQERRLRPRRWSRTCSTTTTSRGNICAARLPSARSDRAVAVAGRVPRPAARADAGAAARGLRQLLRGRKRRGDVHAEAARMSRADCAS